MCLVGQTALHSSSSCIPGTSIEHRPKEAHAKHFSLRCSLLVLTAPADAVSWMQQEEKKASEIVVVSVGPKASRDTIRTALAMGADRGIHVMTDEAVRIDQGLEPLAVAGLLKKVRYPSSVNSQTDSRLCFCYISNEV